jgi:hypothetical protein
MMTQHLPKPSLKQRAKHEFEELAAVFSYLAFFFCALATYSMLLLDRFHVSFFSYGTALINALVISKVILIGEAMHLGKKQEGRPLLLSALNKAFLYGLLVFAFHIIEEEVKRLIHGETIVSAWHAMRFDEVICRTIVIFSTFIPLFAFMELRRVLGDDNFWTLLFRTGRLDKSNFPG